MTDLSLVIGVVVMFFLRIGIPVLVLIILGTLIDRWQTQRDIYIRQHTKAPVDTQKTIKQS